MEELATTHHAAIATIRAIPEAALDWQPEAESWSLKRICAHIASSYDFYVMLVNEVRSRCFGTVRLDRALSGWESMLAADTTVLACSSVPAIRVQVDRAYGRLRTAMEGLEPAEYDRPFVLYDSWAPGAVPMTTVLRERVLRRGTEHLQEHLNQLHDTLSHWRSAVASEGASAIGWPAGEQGLAFDAIEKNAQST